MYVYVYGKGKANIPSNRFKDIREKHFYTALRKLDLSMLIVFVSVSEIRLLSFIIIIIIYHRTYFRVRL